MTHDGHPAEGEALSVDQAATLLGGGPDPEDEAGSDDHPLTDDQDDGAEDSEGAGVQDAEMEGPRPPSSWDAQAQAVFASLPAEAQAVIAEREAERDQAVSQARLEAHEARRTAEAAAEAAPFLGEAVERAAQLFQSQYEGVDWLAWAAQDPEACQAARQDYEGEAAALQQLDAARQAAEALRFDSFLATEARLLPRLAPDLADPHQGPARKARLGGFLLKSGFSAERIAQASAADLALAYDAMRWREAQDGLTSRPGRGAPAHRSVRPTAAQAPRSGAVRRASDALARLSRSGTVEDAVAYLRSRGG